MAPKLPLPRGWKHGVRSSVLHILAVGHYHLLEQRTFAWRTLTSTARGECSRSTSSGSVRTRKALAAPRAAIHLARCPPPGGFHPRRRRLWPSAADRRMRGSRFEL